MIDLVEEAAKLQSFVEENGWDFHFIGGIVVQIWGRPRLTTDLDILCLPISPMKPVIFKHF